MQIAILSDTHDQIGRVERAVDLLRQRQVERVLHCGDIESVETIRYFAGLPIEFVFGNCDGEHREIDGRWRRDFTALKAAMAAIEATSHEPFGHLELAGKKLAWLHGDDGELLRNLIASEHFDYLFHGHTHVARQEKIGQTWVINPGALHRVRQKTLLLLDLATGATETITLE